MYGGGAAGLMGCIADQVLSGGGKVIGIIPDFMKQVEWAHLSITELHIVGDMHERKEIPRWDRCAGSYGWRMWHPGKLLEAITLKRWVLFTKPIIILNTDGYYNHFIGYAAKSVLMTGLWTMIQR